MIRTRRAGAGRTRLEHRVAAFAMAVIGSTGCAAAPVPSDSPDEVEELRARVASVPHDREAAIRGAAGLWSLGRREEAVDLLTSALASSPADGALRAVRGAAAEGVGRYLMARSDYQGALQALRGARPSGELEVRLDDIGVETADALARRLVVDGAGVEREESAGLVVGILPLVPTTDEPELKEIAFGLAELLSRDLREIGTFRLVDPELTSALHEIAGESETSAVSEATARGIARMLHLSSVAWGRMSRSETDALRISLHVLRRGPDGGELVSEMAAEIPRDELPTAPRLLAGRLWELIVGAEEGAFEGDEDWPRVSVERLRAFGRGVEAARRGDHAVAIAEFGVAAGGDDSFTHAHRLAARSSRLLMMRESSSLTFVDEALALARAARTMRALAGERSGTDAGRFPYVGEMFGQDRLGWHRLTDLRLDLEGSR